MDTRNDMTVPGRNRCVEESDERTAERTYVGDRHRRVEDRQLLVTETRTDTDRRFTREYSERTVEPITRPVARPIRHTRNIMENARGVEINLGGIHFYISELPPRI